MAIKIVASVKAEFGRGSIEHRGDGWFRLCINAHPANYDYSNWGKAELIGLRDAIDDVLRETATYETMIRAMRERGVRESEGEQ
jgi:hypothetical protein